MLLPSANPVNADNRAHAWTQLVAGKRKAIALSLVMLFSLLFFIVIINTLNTQEMNVTMDIASVITNS